MDITPLQVHYDPTPPDKPPDISTSTCTLNINPTPPPAIDGYGVLNLKYEADTNDQPIDEQDDDDETSKQLISAFSPSNDMGIEEEIQQITDAQGLSPRGLHKTRFTIKKQFPIFLPLLASQIPDYTPPNHPND